MSFPETSNQESAKTAPASAFPKTRWSIILDAQGDDPAALASFCRTYWFPLHGYARHVGQSVEDAEDLTQSFFERLLARDLLAHARRERGKLRNFLLRSFNNFMAEEQRRLSAQKRGGDQRPVAFDALSAEERLALEPHDEVTPEVDYERAWSRELLRLALEKLQAAYESAGHGPLFHALRDQLADDSGHSHQEIATKLGISESSARFAAFKLRQRYRAILREIVVDTVAAETDVDEELTYLQMLFRK